MKPTKAITLAEAILSELIRQPFVFPTKLEKTHVAQARARVADAIYELTEPDV